MSIVVTAVRQYQAAYEVVLELHMAWDGSSAEALYVKYQRLQAEVDRLFAIPGVAAQSFGNLGRHLWFIELRLRQGHKDICFSDVTDILHTDLPSGFASLLALQADIPHLHGRLAESVIPLLDAGHLASAIRQVFPVLSTHLRQRFLVGENIDGDELVNSIFSQASTVTRLDGPKKTAYRNLMSGFYGVYRNKYAHHDVSPSKAEVHAVIELANSLIFEMEHLAIDAAQAAAQ